MLVKERRCILAVAFGVMLTGCAVLPYQHMSDARQAIDAAEPVAAENIEAEMLLKASRMHLEAAEQHLEQGEHDQARERASMARELAIEARQRGEEENAEH